MMSFMDPDTDPVQFHGSKIKSEFRLIIYKWYKETDENHKRIYSTQINVLQRTPSFFYRQSVTDQKYQIWIPSIETKTNIKQHNTRSEIL